MKTQLTITLPDGWELAEPEARPVRKGEHYYDPNMKRPVDVWDVRDDSKAVYAIVRRTRSEYVNVRMLRTDAEVNPESVTEGWWRRLEAARRAALAAEPER